MQDDISIFLELLGGDRNIWSAPDNHREAVVRIKNKCVEEGIPAEILSFEHHLFTGYNLWIPPPDLTKNFILILGHHDTVPECPGVDDNGSGMLLVYLLAKWYYRLEDKNGLNLAFVMPDFEEGDPRVFKELDNFNEIHGTNYSYKDNYFDPSFWSKFRKHLQETIADITSFVGTRMFIKHLEEVGLIERLQFVIDYETVGYTSKEQKQVPGIPLQMEVGDFLAGVVNSDATKFFSLMNSVDHPIKRIILPIPNKGMTVPDTRRSDHSVFWDKGIDSVMFTDTANFRNPNYHKPSDTELDRKFILDVLEYSQLFLQSIEYDKKDLSS